MACVRRGAQVTTRIELTRLVLLSTYTGTILPQPELPGKPRVTCPKAGLHTIQLLGTAITGTGLHPGI